MPKREFFVVHAKQVQDRGVPIVNVHLVHDCLITVLVRGAITESTFHSATCHPGRVALVVVVAAVTALTVRRPPKLASPDYQRVFEEIALFEIGQETGDGLINLIAAGWKIGREIPVMIPI